MTESIDAYPLQWPMGWARTAITERRSAKFGTKQRKYYGQDSSGGSYLSGSPLTIAQGTERVLNALSAMGHADTVIISSNLQLRNDGLPRSGQREPLDPGVSVYWGTGRNARCMACDHYEKVAGNLGAIAATLEAMRAIKRHGGAAILDRAFTGFKALPAPEQAFQVLGVSANASESEINEAHKRLSMKHHPDRPGGSSDQMARINAARDSMLGDT